ncbi:GNAT family N-acetyltransferase [Alteromonas facilis]|uniref:GNAT family N-acetyltransferase n=1 Tax=Alteromonas facilis TaxID=2048004 RepID=UPI000C2834DA|nr:GNAT family N-acetyltransferase [Alteromonas facilis]
MQLGLETVDSITQLCSERWQLWAQDKPPFLQYAFLSAMERSGSVGADSGWHPKHLRVFDTQSQTDIAYIPAYTKDHSYGEYVFDHAWANAYHQHGLEYYPKLLVAIPFTPVTMAKLLCAPEHIQPVLAFLTVAISDLCEDRDWSSFHWLFDFPKQVPYQSTNLAQRCSVQFQWQNLDYTSFDDFMARFTSRKRKDIRKERRRVCEQGVSIRQLSGSELALSDIEFFYHCYRNTYFKRSGHAGYLNHEFFVALYDNLKDAMMVVMAYKEQQPIASALYFYNESGLFGRYWGALEDIDGLHFECCYYQGIEFAIANELALFNPGTQGEHKLLRGFEPIMCHSFHHCCEPAFHDAVSRYTEQERDSIEKYFAQAQDFVPFKKTE